MSWEKIKLEKLYEVHNGLSKGRQFFGSGYPFLSFSTVFNNYFLPDELDELVQSTDKEQDNYSIQRGDVFVTRTSETSDELGMSCVALKNYPNATYNGFTKRMRPIDGESKILPEYIGYYMRMPSFRAEFQAFSTMTTRASLKNEDLLSLEVSLPPIATQKRIAEILRQYDNLIENNRKQIKLLEEAAQRIYKEWFVDFRFPGYEDCKIIDGIPEGWEKTTIGQFLNVKSGYAFKSEWWQTSGYPVVKIKDIVDNTIDVSGVDYVAPEHTSKIPEFLLQKGDVVIAMTGATIGKIGLVPEVDNLYTNQRVGKIFPKEELKQPSPFLFCFYSQKSITDQIIALSSSSSAQPNISGRQLESFEIKADINVINEFCEVTQPFFEKINSLYKQIDLLKQARNRLLPRLMNGEIEV